MLWESIWRCFCEIACQGRASWDFGCPCGTPRGNNGILPAEPAAGSIIWMPIVVVFLHFRSHVWFRCVFFTMCCQAGFSLSAFLEYFSPSGYIWHEKICSNHCRVFQKQGFQKYHDKAMWHHLGIPDVTIWTLFDVILASNSKKKPGKGRSRKTRFFERTSKCSSGGYKSFRPHSRCQATPAK